MSPPIHVHAQPGGFSPLVVLILVLMALLYLRGWLRLRRTSPTRFSPMRPLVFLSGLLAIWLAVGSPLGILDHQLLTAHMLKHLLLMVVAAPLILFGGAGQRALEGLPNCLAGANSLLVTRLRSFLRPFFNNSVVCWLAGTSAVIVWHIPMIFDLGLSSPSWHTIEDVSFICAGLLFWKPIITPAPNEAQRPGWSLVLYLFLATVPCDIVSAFLAFCDRVVYPRYLSTSQIISPSALQDQEWAGALMWVSITFAYLIPAVLITLELLSSDGVHFAKGAAIASSGTRAAELRGSEMEVT
jgi:cytochrome c oxidase assembly factor CtaG